MAKEFITTDVRGLFILLGTGTSVGVPAIGCGCPVCTSQDSRNQRTRCSLLLGLPQGNLLIDTTPDLRQQFLRERIGVVQAVLYTHSHADHLFGLDDLRIVAYRLGRPVPIYCEAGVERRIRQSFDYAFTEKRPTHPGAVPQLTFQRISTEPFEVLGSRITPIRLQHGPGDVLGFRVGNIAYCTDTNGIPEESWPLLEGLDVLILDALRFRPHPTHYGLDEAVEMARQLQPKQTLFTHCSHELDYETVNARLPDGMQLSYDGYRGPLT